jgi:hypothetical protein
MTLRLCEELPSIHWHLADGDAPCPWCGRSAARLRDMRDEEELRHV